MVEPEKKEETVSVHNPTGIEMLAQRHLNDKDFNES